jgi:hypothetical protein
MRQQRGLVRRFEAFERDQIVAETDLYLRQRIRIADGLQSGDQRRPRRLRQRRNRRERFGERGATNTTGGEEAGDRGGEQHRATHMHVACELRANGGTPCRVPSSWRSAS